MKKNVFYLLTMTILFVSACGGPPDDEPPCEWNDGNTIPFINLLIKHPDNAHNIYPYNSYYGVTEQHQTDLWSFGSFFTGFPDVSEKIKVSVSATNCEGGVKSKTTTFSNSNNASGTNLRDIEFPKKADWFSTTKVEIKTGVHNNPASQGSVVWSKTLTTRPYEIQDGNFGKGTFVPSVSGRKRTFSIYRSGAFRRQMLLW